MEKLAIPTELKGIPELARAYTALHSKRVQRVIRVLGKLDPNLGVSLVHGHTASGDFRILAASERSSERNGVVTFGSRLTDHTDRVPVGYRYIADGAEGQIVAWADCDSHGCGEGGDGTGDG